MIRKKTSFRPDINGLRAWGVAAVVLYHLDVPYFQGGFTGVDIFFVISGFLITGIIVDGMDRDNINDKFLIKTFYISRIRRLLPALVVMCGMLLTIGWFLLPATDYERMARYVIAGLLFYSNLELWSEVGYFDSSSAEQFLLHTWSLSLEWQFYLLWPLTLVLLWHFFPTRLALIIYVSSSFLMSLVASLIITPLHPGAAFYLLPTRAWEFLAGGLIFLIEPSLKISKICSKHLEWIGFMLILGAVVLIPPDVLWPHWLTLVPVIGTVFVMISKNTNSVLTNTRFFQWLGNSSYSIYLWHWPIVVALIYLNLKQDFLAIGVALLLTAVLGHISLHYVENHFYVRSNESKFRRTDFLLIILLVITFIFSINILLKNGIVGRISSEVDSFFIKNKITDNKHADCYKRQSGASECKYGGHILGAIVIGDSHANALLSPIESTLLNTDKHVLGWTLTSCPPVLGVKKKDGADPLYCDAFIAEKFRIQRQLPANVPIILAGRFSAYAFGSNILNRKNYHSPSIYFSEIHHEISNPFLLEYRNHIIDTACSFARTRPVYLVRPTPEMHSNVPRAMGMAMLRGDPERVSIRLDEYHLRNSFLWEAQDAARIKCGVMILDPLPYLCSNGKCWGDKDGVPLYKDDNHLNDHGAALLSPMFGSLFQ